LALAKDIGLAASLGINVARYSHAGIVMTELIGRWSTLGFYPHDPQNEVLVFLPDGTGVFEFYWWRLSSYETFNYVVESNQLTIHGTEMYAYSDDTKHVETETSRLRFVSSFSIRQDDHQATTGYVNLLEFDRPFSLSRATKFGRRAADVDVSVYKPPVFAGMDTDRQV